MYTVQIDMPTLPKGHEVEIDGLGQFENGSTVEVSKEDAEAFRVKHQAVVMTTDKDGNNHIEVFPGPTLLQAFKDNDTIVVSTSKSKSEDKSKAGETSQTVAKPVEDDKSATTTVKTEKGDDK